MVNQQMRYSSVGFLEAMLFDILAMWLNLWDGFRSWLIRFRGQIYMQYPADNIPLLSRIVVICSCHLLAAD